VIDISGLTKASVLAALYNASAPVGMGFIHYTSGDMSEAEAEKALTTEIGPFGRPLYFDYVRGRALKVDLSKDSFDPWLFDRDNGKGAAARAIEKLRGSR
jgi:hypothetical protein